MFLDCPAYLDQDGAARCGLPAEVSRWFTMGSTDGPLESAVIRCAASSKPSASASLTLKGPARRPPRRSRPARARGTVGTTTVKDTAAAALAVAARVCRTSGPAPAGRGGTTANGQDPQTDRSPTVSRAGHGLLRRLGTTTKSDPARRERHVSSWSIGTRCCLFAHRSRRARDRRVRGRHQRLG